VDGVSEGDALGEEGGGGEDEFAVDLAAAAAWDLFLMRAMVARTQGLAVQGFLGSEPTGRARP
jgi:hypothetical protein